MADLTEEQKMLEKPVKGYQLRELTNAVLDWKESTNKKLDDIATSVRGVATTAELATMRSELEKDFQERMLASEKTIHQEYGPMKKNLTWFIRLVISAVVGIAVQAALLIWSLTGGGRG